MATRGISGLAVGLATIGGYLIYASINDVPLRQGLIDVAHGRTPKGTPSTGSKTAQNVQAKQQASDNPPDNPSDPVTGVSKVGEGLAAAARKYLGVPYRWGGTDPKTGLDCSGLVQLAFRDIGIPDCPRTSTTIHLWSKLRKVSTPVIGDVLWWNGHVAIASSSTSMVEAPTVGIPVRETKIRRGYTALRYVG